MAAKELARMRTQFVQRVTAENLTQLLEALVTDNVLNELEKERIQEMNQTRADKARDFIDTVKKKGEKFCPYQSTLPSWNALLACWNMPQVESTMSY
uniref:CARD domain-containing protein n=1 Tax=Pundamilia nyererei TaxID=303518 RepID=A0A3B4H2P7_9CICH